MTSLKKQYHDIGKKYLEENIENAQKEIIQKSSEARLTRVIVDTQPGKFCQIDFISELKHTSYSTFCNQDKSNYNFSETIIDPIYITERRQYTKYSSLKVSYGDFLRKLLGDNNSASLIKNGTESYSLFISLNGLDTINPYWEAVIHSWDDQAPSHIFKASAKNAKRPIEVIY